MQDATTTNLHGDTQTHGSSVANGGVASVHHDGAVVNPTKFPAEVEPDADRFRWLVENAFGLIAEVDDRGHFTYLSPNYLQLLGYHPEELVGQQSLDYVHPDDVDLVAPALHTAIVKRREVRLEFRFRHREGDWRWLESMGRAIELPDGRLRLGAMSRDITARRRKEQENATLFALAKTINAQHNLQMVAQTLSDHLKPLLPFDLLFISIWRNNMLHAAAWDEAGKVRHDFRFSPDLPTAVPGMWETIQRRSIILDNDCNFKGVHEEACPCRSYINVPLYAEDELLGLLHLDSLSPHSFTSEHVELARLVGEQVAVAVHQSELFRQTQDALKQAREAESRFRDLLHQIDAVVWEADPETQQFTFVSPQAESWLGYPLSAWTNFAKWSRWVHPEDRKRVNQATEQAISTGIDHNLEYRIVGAQGQVLWLQELVSVEVQDGRTTRLHGIMFDISERKRSEEELRLLDRALEATTTGILIINARRDNHPITYVNPAWVKMTGYRPTEAIGRSLDFLQCDASDAQSTLAARKLHHAIAECCACQVTLQLCRKDGSAFWCEMSISPVRGPQDQVTHFIAVQTDISERQKTENAVWETNAILRATQEAAADGICLVDDIGRVVSCNQRFADMWQIPLDLLEELRKDQQLMLYILSTMQDPDEFIDKIAYLSDHPRASTRDEILLNDGRIFERFSAPAISPQGQSHGRVWSFSDITDRKHYEQQLAHQAFHDPLTQLPNRLLFMDNLTRAIARARRSGSCVAVLFLDLDRFKVVNDSLGHETGDLLLIETARRLKQCLRPGDMAARFGGDEFTVLLENVGQLSDATRVAERIAEALNVSFDLGGHEVCTTTSIGIVLSHAGADRGEDLLRDADVAMYRAKSKGRAQYEVFDAEMSAAAFERLKTEIELRQGMKREQLLLHYQPLVDLKSGRIIGAEALVRWQHPERGLIYPGDFIPIAEESGIILPLGQWVLQEACRQMRRWQKEFAIHDDWTISVNLSAKQFQQLTLVEDMTRILREAELEPHHLNVEITESVMMEAASATSGLLISLRKIGVRLSIDDFGTGYSSLSYLRRFPLDTLKVDRSFIDRAGNDDQDAAIVQAVHSLAKALGMKVVAEGVETREQLDHLRKLNCDVAQGYYFAKPLPRAKFEALLQSNPHW